MRAPVTAGSQIGLQALITWWPDLAHLIELIALRLLNRTQHLIEHAQCESHLLTGTIEWRLPLYQISEARIAALAENHAFFKSTLVHLDRRFRSRFLRDAILDEFHRDK